VPGKLFREIATEFLTHHALYSADPATMQMQVVVLNRFFGELKMAAIGPTEVEAFLAGRILDGLSKSTCNRNRSALSTLFTWAIERGRAVVNPVKAVRRFPERPKETPYLSPEEMARLTIAAAPHLKAYLVTLAYTGGRMTETLRLRWSWIDFDAGAVTFVRETTKSRKTRVVPMTAPLRQALSGLRRGKPDSFVFLYNERPVLSMRTALRTAARRAGLAPIGFHVLRHTYATWFVQNDGPIALLQRLLGHSTVGLTMRYCHVSRDYLMSGARFVGPPSRVKAPEGEVPG